jgi:methylated-DNA-[protein]-cysteine S-methyltransferase
MFVQYLESSIRTIKIKASELGVTAIHLKPEKGLKDDNPNNYTQKCCKQLNEYFNKERTEFELEYDFGEATYFQKSVWNALLKIPFGHTISYAELSERLNNPKAIRAVGAANGKNPIAICVPCHRVIGSDGSLTGYASGLDMKQQLLMLENPNVFGKQTELAF